MEELQKKHNNLLLYILLAAVTFTVYIPVLQSGFINFDDNYYITGNPIVQSGLNFKSIKWALTTSSVGYWHPISWLSHLVDCQIFGLRPWGHHLVNLLIHIANTLLLFALLKSITGQKWQSLFVALIFAVHPLNVESVAWIAERKNVLSTLFLFLTIAAYVNYTKDEKKGWYITTLLLFIAGLMTKPMLVTIPVLLLILDYWPLNRIKNTAEGKTRFGWLIIEKIPFLLLSFNSALITIMGQKNVGALKTTTQVPLVLRLENTCMSYIRYIGKIFSPTNLSVFYPMENMKIQPLSAILAASFLIIFSAFIFIIARKYKYLLMGWLWYLITLLPVIGLVQVGNQSFADRYAYISTIGLLIMIVWSIADLSKNLPYKKITLLVFSIIITVAMSTATIFQLSHWKNDIALFNQAINIKPSSLMYYALAGSYRAQNNYTKAIEAFEQSLKIKPDYYEVLCGLAVTYAEIGQHKKAIEILEEAIKLKPDKIDAYCNLGAAYGDIDKNDEAIKTYEQVLKISPDCSTAYFGIGVIYGKLGKHQQEVESYKQAIDANPFYVDAYQNLSIAYTKMGKYKEALDACKKTVEIKPNLADAHKNLIIIYLIMGNKKSALKEYEILKKLNPEMADDMTSLFNNTKTN